MTAEIKAQHVLGRRFAEPPGAPEDDPPHIHRTIDNSIPPELTIRSGETVAFECPGLPLPRNATVEDISRIDPQRPHTIVGPVEVADAAPGDTLAIEILEIDLIQDYGHTLFMPGAGLLGGEIEAPYLRNFEWTAGSGFAEMSAGIRIPFNPFCGILGVMPKEPGEHATVPPRATGGNIDVRHLVPGATLLLPVEVPGAMFFAGDGHAAQGDGEVSITGLETAVRATLRLSVNKGRTIREPQFLTPAPLSVESAEQGYYGTCGVGPDLYLCSQNAIRHMIGYLVSEHDLSWEDAYILCSLVVDLKISEVVDAPNWLVSAYLPLSVFESG